MKLENKTIVITGGASGIGLELALRLRSNNRIILCDIRKRSLFKLRKKFLDMDIAHCDITVESEVSDWQRRVQEKYQSVDVLINNAGVGKMHDMVSKEFKFEEIRLENEVNFISQIRVTHAFLPLLRKSSNGVLIFMSSGLAIIPYYRAFMYSASKAALHSYVQSLRKSLENENLRVIEVFPPLVATRLSSELNNAVPVGEFLDGFFQELATGADELYISHVKDTMAHFKKDPSGAFAYVESLYQNGSPSIENLRKLLK